MQILIMSDTHGDESIISRVQDFYPKVQSIIHCGDSELPADHPALQDLVYVKGNCDRDDRFSEESIISLGDAKFYVTHGHLFNVKSSLMSLTYRAQEVGAHVVCFGHSHLLGAEMIDGILYVNPGSLKAPRGRKEKTFIILELGVTDIQVKCLTSDNELLEELTFQRI